MKTSNIKFLSNKWHIWVLAVMTSVVLGVGGYFYYSYSAKLIRSEKENELKAIASLKIDQLVQWHQERTADTKVVLESPFFVQVIENWLNNKFSKPLKADILEFLNSQKKNYGYENIFLTSTQGELLLSLDSKYEKIDNSTAVKIAESAKTNKITFTDFYYCNTHQKVHYNIIAPIVNKYNKTVSILVFRIDPDTYIYPLIQSWPTPSKTSETLLFKKDGDSVLYLNELRHQKNTALKFRLSLSQKDLPAAQAILGKKGIFYGKDYRGADVISYLSPVPNTDWFITAKVDTDEIFGDLYVKGILIFFFSILLILSLIGGIVWIYHYRQKNLYKGLWQIQEDFKTILYSIGDAVIATDLNGQVKYMNKVAEKLTGWTENEAIGIDSSTVFNIISEETRKKVENPVEKVLREGEVVGLANHTLLIAKDGIEIPIADSGAPIKNEKGEIIGSVLVFRDQTEEKLSQSKLYSLNAIIENSFNEICIIDAKTLKIIYANKNSLENLGYTKQEINTLTLLDIKPLFTLETFLLTVKPLLSGEINILHLETIHQRKDGSTYPVDIFLQLTHFEEKQVIVAFIIDVTKLEKLENIKTKLIRVIEQSPVSVFITDPEGKIEYVNEKLCELTGYTKEEILFNKPNIFKSGFTNNLIYENLWNSIKIGKNWEGELQNKKKNGELFWEFLRISPLINEENIITNFVAVKEDITDKKKMLDELIIAKEKAQESDRLKSAFLANMSHEIRTPMNGILGFADLLKEPNLTTEKQQKYIRIIEKSGARMLNIINDIVDISKIEAGLMLVDLKESNINEQIEYIYTFFKPEVEAKGIQLFFKNTLENKEAVIETDREKVYAILTNLVKNAIKYTQHGTIEFGYERKGEMLEFFVKDTGMGVPKNRQEAIFERFIQADIADKMAMQGAGLGLSIAKAYVEKLGGKIWIESEEGMGSTFYFTLPYQTKLEDIIHTKKEIVVESMKSIRNLKILVVEDDETSETLISLMIEKYSKEIIKAQTGIEAIETCKKNPDIDLILMDIQLPKMSGYEATSEIRKFNNTVVIIAQTAYGLSGDRTKSIQAGCNDYISKPINKDELMALLQKYFYQLYTGQEN